MRTGKPTQHYLLFEVIEHIAKKSDEIKKKKKYSGSTYVNDVFRLLREAELPGTPSDKKKAIKQFAALLEQ